MKSFEGILNALHSEIVEQLRREKKQIRSFFLFLHMSISSQGLLWFLKFVPAIVFWVVQSFSFPEAGRPSFVWESYLQSFFPSEFINSAVYTSQMYFIPNSNISILSRLVSPIPGLRNCNSAACRSDLIHVNSELILPPFAGSNDENR
jgi:hypothetical protein